MKTLVVGRNATGRTNGCGLVPVVDMAPLKCPTPLSIVTLGSAVPNSVVVQPLIKVRGVSLSSFRVTVYEGHALKRSLALSIAESFFRLNAYLTGGFDNESAIRRIAEIDRDVDNNGICWATEMAVV
jgi:hypothetical protein